MGTEWRPRWLKEGCRLSAGNLAFAAIAGHAGVDAAASFSLLPCSRMSPRRLAN
jgi:hypothetical protein